MSEVNADGPRQLASGILTAKKSVIDTTQEAVKRVGAFWPNVTAPMPLLNESIKFAKAEAASIPIHEELR